MSAEQLPEWLTPENEGFLRSLLGGFNPAAEATVSATHGLGMGSPSALGKFGALTGGAGALASLLFGGGDAYGDLAGDLGNIRPILEQYLKEAKGELQPFYKAGTGALSDYMGEVKEAEDPTGFLASIMGKYQESPSEKYQREQAMKALNASAATRGLIGSGAQARGLQTRAQQLASLGQQRYLSDVLGIRRQNLADLGRLTGMGQQAGTQMGMWDIGTGQNIANLMSQIAQAQAQQEAQESSSWESAIGDIAGAAGALAFL